MKSAAAAPYFVKTIRFNVRLVLLIYEIKSIFFDKIGSKCALIIRFYLPSVSEQETYSSHARKTKGVAHRRA